MIRLYSALIHKDPDSDYGASFPDFPGCVTAGADLEELDRMAAEALQLHVDGLVDEGASIPAPLAAEVVRRLAAGEDALGVLYVPVRKPETRARRATAVVEEVARLTGASRRPRAADD